MIKAEFYQNIETRGGTQGVHRNLSKGGEGRGLAQISPPQPLYVFLAGE